MIVVRFKVKSQPGKAQQVLEAFRAVVPASRLVEGVISFDIGRDVVDADAFIATEVFADRAALARQESLPEVAAALGILEHSLASEPEATVYEVSSAEAWAG